MPRRIDDPRPTLPTTPTSSPQRTRSTNHPSPASTPTQPPTAIRPPFGTEFQYKVIKRNPDGSVDWKAGENAFLIVDPTDARFGNESNGRMIRSDAF